MKKIYTVLLTITIFLSTCAPKADEPVSSDSPIPTDSNGYAPQDSDASLIQGEAYIDSTDLLVMESYPLQFTLNLKGNLPTPCHQLRVLVNPADAENKILVEVYSLTNPDQICVQVLSPFEVNVSLGSFTTGHYFLYVNGKQVSEFDS